MFTPLVDDKGIDLVIRREGCNIYRSSSKRAVKNNKSPELAADFSSITHTPQENYFFVFYSEQLDTFWIMTSEEFLKEASQMKNGPDNREMVDYLK